MSRIIKHVFAIAAGACALLLAPAAAHAATITVNTGGDGAVGCTLRTAINSADIDDDVGDCLASGTYGNDIVDVPASVGPTIQLATTELDAGGLGTLTVQGPGASTLDVEGGTVFRVFRIVGNVTISGLTISNGNQAGELALGGGVRVETTGDLTLDRVTVTGNTANASGSFPQALGGGIYALGPLTIRDSTVSSNNATATVTTAGTTDSSFAAGGGVYVAAADLTIERSTISGNNATGIAAATSTEGSFGSGGGLNFDNSSGENDALVRLTTVSGNTATGAFSALGGGMVIFVFSDSTGTGTRTLQSNTITANTGTATANNGSKVANLVANKTTIQNTLVSNPQGGGPNCPTDTFVVSSGGFNLESPTNTCGFNQSSDQKDVANAGLDPNLANNGGPTLTHALLPSSPAIDTGNSFTELTDQRGTGFARPVDFPGLANASGGDGADIGAFERQQACAGQPTPSTPCRTLTVAKAGTGAGTVAATGIDCGVDCTEQYVDGSQVVLTAAPAAGSVFAGWTGCDNPVGAQCTQTMDSDETVTAIFNLQPAGGGGTTPPPAGTTPPTTPPLTTPFTPPPSTATGRRAAALRKCKKVKDREKRKKCKKRARRLPV